MGKALTSRSWIVAMASSSQGPGPVMMSASFFGQRTATSRVVKEPPNRGQSASTKRRKPRTDFGLVRQGGAHELGLLEHSVDELAAVS